MIHAMDQMVKQGQMNFTSFCTNNFISYKHIKHICPPMIAMINDTFRIKIEKGAIHAKGNNTISPSDSATH